MKELSNASLNRSSAFKILYFLTAANYILSQSFMSSAGYPFRAHPLLVLLISSLIFSAFLFFRNAAEKKNLIHRAWVDPLILSWLSTCVIGRFSGSASHVITLVLFACLAIFFRHTLSVVSTKSVKRGSLLLGTIFSLFLFLGIQMRSGYLVIFSSPFVPAMVLADLFLLMGSILLLTSLLHTMFVAILAYNLPAGNSRFSCPPWLKVTVMTLILMACWSPYYYAFYPGILSVDSIVELNQQLGLLPVTNHHPYIHQLLVALSLKLGASSTATGVGLYSLIQMFLLALCFSLSIRFLETIGIHWLQRLALLAFFALFRVNAFYSVTMWKDVLHGAITLLLLILLIKETHSPSSSGRPLGSYLLLSLVLFLFGTFRNNGYHAFLLGFPFFILCNREKWKRLCSLYMFVILLISSYNFALFQIVGIGKSSVGEALSVPIQQVARTAIQNPDEWDDPDFQTLETLFPSLSFLAENYDPGISDPLKSALNSNILEGAPAKYLRSWIRLGIKHPLSYLEAFLMQNLGYWYPDIQTNIVFSDIVNNSFDLHHLDSRSPVRSFLYTRFLTSASGAVSFLYSLALMVWVLLIAVTILCLKGYRKAASPALLLAVLWFTVLLSPVNIEYRYLYGIVVSAPTYLVLALGLPNNSAV